MYLLRRLYAAQLFYFSGSRYELRVRLFAEGAVKLIGQRVVLESYPPEFALLYDLRRRLYDAALCPPVYHGYIWAFHFRLLGISWVCYKERPFRGCQQVRIRPFEATGPTDVRPFHEKYGIRRALIEKFLHIGVKHFLPRLLYVI